MMDYEYYFNDIASNGYSAINIFGGIIVYFILMSILFSGLIYIFKMIYSYKLFKKMGRKGWEGLIPIYNTIIKLQILNIPIWMIIFLFIPGINVALSVIISINIAKKFDKDILFTIGLIFAPIVFYSILAFGKSEFNPDISGIFDDSIIENVETTYGYCTNCGAKLTGNYCSVCGTKKD